MSGRRAPFRASDCGRIDDGQTNSVSFDTTCLAVEHRFEPAPADGLTMDRQILLVLTQSVWPSSALPSQRSADGLKTRAKGWKFMAGRKWYENPSTWQQIIFDSTQIPLPSFGGKLVHEHYYQFQHDVENSFLFDFRTRRFSREPPQNQNQTKNTARRQQHTTIQFNISIHR